MIPIFKNKRVLLVEDYELSTIMIRELLQMLGIEVDVTDNGQDAIKMVRENRYDAVLMDIQIPTTDGVQATRHIRQFDRGKVPIIAITAGTGVADRETCLKAGMNAFLLKPVTAQQIAETFERLWEKKQGPPFFS